MLPLEGVSHIVTLHRYKTYMGRRNKCTMPHLQFTEASIHFPDLGTFKHVPTDIIIILIHT